MKGKPVRYIARRYGFYFDKGIAGMSTDDFDAVMGNRPLLEAIVEMRQKAYRSWEIQSTPSFVVNDKTIISGDLSYEDFAAKINATDA